MSAASKAAMSFSHRSTGWAATDEAQRMAQTTKMAGRIARQGNIKVVRYLVTARVKSGRRQALDRAIDEGTLGAGSIAGDEYLHNMEQARALRRRSGEVGGNVLLRDAARRGAAVLGGLLRSRQRERRSRAKPVPPRERHRVLGVLNLRLHRTTRSQPVDARGSLPQGQSARVKGITLCPLTFAL